MADGEGIGGAQAAGTWSRKRLTRHYNTKLSVFGRLEHEASFILRSALSMFGDRIYSVKSRVKSIDSLAQKADRLQSPRPFESIADIVGLRVVCLYRSDLAEIRRTIEESFEIIEVDDKGDGRGNPSTFDYESIHFHARLPGDCGGPRYDGLTIEVFEIQLRTLAMDSWATISHNLSYKKGWEIPASLEKDFHAVAALLHLADKHFDDVYRHVAEQKANAASGLADIKPRLQMKVSPYSLDAYLQWKFPDRKHVTDSSVGEVAQALLEHGVRTLGALDRLVDKGLPSLVDDERRYLEDREEGEEAYYFWDLAAARGAVRFADPSFDAFESTRAKEAIRASVLETMPISVEIFLELAEALVTELPSPETCDHTLARSRAFLESQENVDTDATIRWLEGSGGYCDCEVVLNIAWLFEDGDGTAAGN